MNSDSETKLYVVDSIKLADSVKDSDKWQLHKSSREEISSMGNYNVNETDK